MRVLAGALATLVVGASALPQTYDPSFDLRETCFAIESKSQENWVKSGLGEWFVVMANGEDIYEKDIQKTIQSWEGSDSSLYGFHCSPMSHCDVNLDKDQCLDRDNSLRPRLYFILWSIRNLNNWLYSMMEAVDRTAGIADGLAADLVDTFATNMENIPMSTAGSAIAAGILGSIAGIFPAASAAGGFGSGLATIAGGIITLINERGSAELEPKFNDFTAVTKYIARASETMQKSIETYAHWLLTEVPSNDRSNGVYYVDDPKSLPNVLLNGDFAEPRVTEILPNSIYVSLFSAAIAILWKGESANVIKIPHGVSFLPNACEQENFFEGNSWCDGEGNAYLLLGWDTTGKWAKAPWDGGLVDKYKDLKGIDKLSDYKLDIETVVKASEHAQSLNGGEPYYEWNTDRVIDHMNGGEQNLARFSGFNLPFCELHDFEGLDNENCGAECQVIWAMRDCYQGKTYEDSGLGQIHFQDRCQFTDCTKFKICNGMMPGCG